GRPRGRCDDRALRRIRHCVHHAGVLVSAVGTGASWRRARSVARAGDVLARPGAWWFRVLRTVWTPDRPIPAAFLKLLPKWLVVSGIALAVIGELSWLDLIVPKALALVPLARFPGFAWLIAAGFALPTTIERSAPATTERIVRGKVA